MSPGPAISLHCVVCKKTELGLVGWCGEDICEGCRGFHTSRCPACQVAAFPALKKANSARKYKQGDKYGEGR